MATAVAKSIREGQTAPADAGAVALIKRYAELMDQAAELADEAGAIDPEDMDQARRLDRLSAKVSAQQVAIDLGPRLLAALTSLGLTLAGRTTTAKTDKGVPSASAIRSPVDELRARRAARAN